MVEKKPVVMLWDTREKDDELKGYLQKLGAYLNEQYLEIGDIVIPGSKRTFVIEHKSVSDFGNSIRDGRLFKQIKDMVDNSIIEGQEYQPVLLLVGHVSKLWKVNKFSEWQIAALENTIQMDWGVPIMKAHNNYYASVKLISLARKHQLPSDKKKTYPLRFGAKKKMSKEEEALYVLEGFPGISCGRSKTILEEYGTLGDALNAMRDGDIKEIHGIKDKIADAVQAVFLYGDDEDGKSV